MKKLLILCLAAVTSLTLFVVPSASAVVPNFSLSTPTNGQKVGHSLSINGYVSNVDVQMQCTVPGNSPGFTNDDCTYMNRWVSIGISIFGVDGPRTVTVRATATDGSGQYTEISRNIVVDRVAPTLYINSGPAQGSTVTGDDFSWSFSASESVTYECNFDDAGWNACSSPFSVTDIDDGAHTFSVRGYDGVNTGSATRSFTVTNAPPVVTLNSVNGTAFDGTTIDTGRSVSVNHSTNRPDASVECSLDSGSWEDCGPWGGLADGLHTIDLRAYLPGPTDVQDPPVRVTIDVDGLPPTISFAGVAVHQAGTTAQIPWSASETLDFSECNLDGDGWIDPCPTEFTGLSAGAHNLTFNAEDAVGNGLDSEVVFTFYMYPGPPNTVIVPAQLSSQAVDVASFTLFGAGSFGSYECRVNTVSMEWRAPCNSALKIAAGEYPAGTHTLEVRAVDPVGQVDPTPASATFTLNALPIAAPKLSSFSGKGKSVNLKTSGAGELELTVETCKKKKVKKKTRTVCKKFASAKAAATGAGKVNFKLKKKLKKGVKYKFTVTATSPTGQKSKTVKTVKAK